MIMYSQVYSSDDTPRDYYEPNLLFNEKGFTIQAGEEFLLIITGAGYRLEDEAIYHLEAKKDEENEVVRFTLSSTFTDRQLCLLVRNRSTGISYHIAKKTSLAWLLDLSCITSKLCHVAITEMTKARLGVSRSKDTAANHAQNTRFPLSPPLVHDC